MKPLKDRAAQSVRLSKQEIDMVSEALKLYARWQSNLDPPKARHARVIRKALPTSLPYTLIVFPTEWEIISRALRPEGSNPTPGSEHAYWYSLYQKLRRRMVFLTEGDERRVRAAKKTYRRFGKMS